MFDLQIDLGLVAMILGALIVLVGSIIVVRVSKKIIEGLAKDRPHLRKGPISQVQKFIQIIVYSVAVILVLWIFEVDVTGLIASLGIGAIVIGFALKETIENWISGLLLISGKTYVIGDVVKIGDLTGVVTAISLRTTRLKTYDRNEIIIPNSKLLRENIINLTSGKKETIASISFYIDYTFDVQKAKSIIEEILKVYPNVIVDKKREREIRFVVRIKEWTTEIEALFWINDPENQEFIKSKISEAIKTRFEEAKILPPIPPAMRKEYIESRK